jgi:hypothetical protein
MQRHKKERSTTTPDDAAKEEPGARPADGAMEDSHSESMSPSSPTSGVSSSMPKRIMRNAYRWASDACHYRTRSTSHRFHDLNVFCGASFWWCAYPS